MAKRRKKAKPLRTPLIKSHRQIGRKQLKSYMLPIYLIKDIADLADYYHCRQNLLVEEALIRFIRAVERAQRLAEDKRRQAAGGEDERKKS